MSSGSRSVLYKILGVNNRPNPRVPHVTYKMNGLIGLNIPLHTHTDTHGHTHTFPPHLSLFHFVLHKDDESHQ